MIRYYLNYPVFIVPFGSDAAVGGDARGGGRHRQEEDSKGQRDLEGGHVPR